MRFQPPDHCTGASFGSDKDKNGYQKETGCYRLRYPARVKALEQCVETKPDADTRHSRAQPTGKTSLMRENSPVFGQMGSAFCQIILVYVIIAVLHDKIGHSMNDNGSTKHLRRPCSIQTNIKKTPVTLGIWRQLSSHS